MPTASWCMNARQHRTGRHAGAVYDRPASAFVAGFIGAPAMNLLPARLERGAAVLADGTRLAAPGAGGGAGDVLCGIRPEELVWIGDRDEAAALRGRAIAVEPLGADTLVTIAVAGAEIAARLPPRSIRHTGETVALSLDPARLHLFDRATGRRLPVYHIMRGRSTNDAHPPSRLAGRRRRPDRRAGAPGDRAGPQAGQHSDLEHPERAAADGDLDQGFHRQPAGGGGAVAGQEGSRSAQLLPDPACRRHAARSR